MWAHTNAAEHRAEGQAKAEEHRTQGKAKAAEHRQDSKHADAPATAPGSTAAIQAVLATPVTPAPQASHAAEPHGVSADHRK